MSDSPPTLRPNDPLVVQSVVNDLNAAIQDLSTYLVSWQGRVDAMVVQLQNAAASEVLPDGGTTGQVPANVPVPPEPAPPQPEPTPPVETPTEPSTEPTGLPTHGTPGIPPEDTTGTAGVTHDFIDPSGDDTIADPSGDDRSL